MSLVPNVFQSRFVKNGRKLRFSFLSSRTLRCWIQDLKKGAQRLGLHPRFVGKFSRYIKDLPKIEAVRTIIYFLVITLLLVNFSTSQQFSCRCAN